MDTLKVLKQVHKVSSNVLDNGLVYVSVAEKIQGEWVSMGDSQHLTVEEFREYYNVEPGGVIIPSLPDEP